MNDATQNASAESTDDARPVEHLDTESRLHEALEDWDRNRPPEPELEDEPEEIAEYERRIADLEGNVSEATTRAEELEGQLSEATTRAAESESLNENAVAFYDEARDWMDHHDHGRLLDHLERETGADRRVLDLEVKMRLLEDESFREAADDRFEDPDRFQAMLSEFEDDLRERYPSDTRDHGLASAVRAARTAPPSADHGEFGGLDVARMSPHAFEQHSREVLAAFKGGRLHATGRRRSSGWSTMPD